MSFSEKIVNAVQATVITVVSAVIFVTLTGTTVYGGSRATDWAFGLPKHTSIKWLGNHAEPIAHGINALAHIAKVAGVHAN